MVASDTNVVIEYLKVFNLDHLKLIVHDQKYPSSLNTIKFTYFYGETLGNFSFDVYLIRITQT